MNTIAALIGVVIKEMYRRKDFYVLFVLTVVITLTMGSVHFFNDAKIVRYLKEICLLLIWIAALIIAITTTARQIPAERESRTIFPLLAKPVTRAQVLLGKFFGCWFAVGAALIIFYLFFGIISSSHEGTWPILNYFEAFWLQWMMLAIVISMTLFGSIIFSAVSANATICFFVVVGILLLGGHLNTVALNQPQPVGNITYTIYFIIPHLEWFDVRDLVVYDWHPVPFLDCLLATVYAWVYSAIFIFLSWLAFRRKALTA